MAPNPDTYTVLLSSHASRDVQESADYINESGDANRANIWIKGLLDSLDSLASMLARYAPAPESEEMGVKVRHLPYFAHRIIFLIKETSRTMQVLRVYHGARTPLHLEDLP